MKLNNLFTILDFLISFGLGFFTIAAGYGIGRWGKETQFQLSKKYGSKMILFMKVAGPLLILFSIFQAFGW